MNSTAIFIFLFSITLTIDYTSYNQVCGMKTRFGKGKFKDMRNNGAECSWDPASAFLSGKKLGKGSFGLVKKVKFTDSKAKTFDVALKEMKPTSLGEDQLILKEISAMDTMGQAGSIYVPQIFGCYVFDEYPKRVYIAQERLGHDLDSTTYISYFQTLQPAESSSIIIQMFKGLRDLWKGGYSHNDIKPANMMARKDNNNSIVLIDFGLAKKVGSRHFFGGTPVFMSPARFTSSGQIQPKDDIYSVAVSIVIMKAKNGFDDVFKGITYSKYGSAHYKCFELNLNKACRQQIAWNAASILKRAKFGDYNSSQALVKGINLTTLIVNMILYDNYNLDYLQTVELLRDIESNLNQGKEILLATKQEPDAYTQELIQKYEQAEKLRREQKDARKKREEIIKEKELAEQNRLKVAQEVKLKQQNEERNKFNEILDKIEQERKAREERLNLAKQKYEQKRQNYEDYNNQFTRSTDMYKNSKQMLESMRNVNGHVYKQRDYWKNKHLIKEQQAQIPDSKLPAIQNKSPYLQKIKPVRNENFNVQENNFGNFIHEEKNKPQFIDKNYKQAFGLNQKGLVQHTPKKQANYNYDPLPYIDMPNKQDAIMEDVYKKNLIPAKGYDDKNYFLPQFNKTPQVADLNRFPNFKELNNPHKAREYDIITGALKESPNVQRNNGNIIGNVYNIPNGNLPKLNYLKI